MPSKLYFASAVVLGAFALHTAAAQAAGHADLDCKLKFSLSTWSVIIEHSEGVGIVSCGNGESMRVSITAIGAGLTAGKSVVDNGTGRFTDIRNISEVLGTYAEGEAHAGVVKSSDAQLLTKGTVSLALAGKGEGIDLGIDVGEFTLLRKK